MNPAATELLADPPPYAPAAGDDTHEQTANEKDRAAALSVADQFPDLPGYQLDGFYRVGGMGLVFRGLSLRLECPVAIKVIRPERVISPADTLRFENEAKAAAAVRHLHVAQVYDRGEHLGRSYYVSEWLAGGSLADRLLARGPLPPADAARLAYKLAGAVHACHEAGVIHRDVKPSNVLLDADGQPKLIDFGVALRLVRAASTQAFSLEELDRKMVGTPRYMAPEQYGSANTANRPADVYALGVVLYELLTGRVPFPENEPEEYHRLQTTTPPPPLPASVPARLATVCLGCLAVEPAARYATARQVANDLSRFVAGEAVDGPSTKTADPPRPVSPIPKPRSMPPPFPLRDQRPGSIADPSLSGGPAQPPYPRRSARKWLAVAAGVLVVGAGVGESWRGATTRHRLAMTEYARRLDRAAADPTSARRWLDDCPADRRGWEWRYLDRQARGVVSVPGPRALAGPTTPDGRRTVTVDSDAVRIWCANTGVELVVLPVRGATTAGFTTDGTAVIAVAADGRILAEWDAGPATSD